MGFFNRVARDIQVIITGEGNSKPKRQRYNPAKAKKRKGKFVRKPSGGGFAAKMKKKYGDQASSLNTETQRDPGKKTKALESYRKAYFGPGPLSEAFHKAKRELDKLGVSVRERNDALWKGPRRDPEAKSETIPMWIRTISTDALQRRALATPRSDPDFWFMLRELKARGALPTSLRGLRAPKALSRKSTTSRDFEDDVRHLSLTALGRLLRQYHQRGDDAKCHVIEKEIDRRTKGFRGRR